MPPDQGLGKRLEISTLPIRQTRTGKGVIVIKLNEAKGDRLVDISLVGRESGGLAATSLRDTHSTTALGRIKRPSVNHACRGCQPLIYGVTAALKGAHHAVSCGAGNITEEVMFVSRGGLMCRSLLSSISITGRLARGSSVLNLQVPSSPLFLRYASFQLIEGQLYAKFLCLAQCPTMSVLN